MTRKKYDAIVVGVDHNGLTAAAYLARAGLSTLVLERRAIVGGCCVTEEIAQGGRARGKLCRHRLHRPNDLRSSCRCLGRSKRTRRHLGVVANRTTVRLSENPTTREGARRGYPIECGEGQLERRTPPPPKLQIQQTTPVAGDARLTIGQLLLEAFT